MTEVVLHIYDVTNSGSEKTNNTILQINRFFKDGIGLGGIFHSAIQVYGDEEWSYGFCEQGTGVFSCPSSKNPMYTYREKIVLGKTDCTIFMVNQILRELSREWPGHSYDLLSKNCNHFCDVLCDVLGVPKLPGWVNRFAHAGDTALEVAGNTAMRIKQAKTEIVSASKVAYRFLSNVTSNVTNGSSNGLQQRPGTLTNSENGNSRLQGSWFKGLLNTSKPSTSTEIDNKDDDENQQRKQSRDSAPLNHSAYFMKMSGVRMLASSPMLLFLLSLLMASYFDTTAGQIGVCFGQMGNNIPNPAEVVAMFKQYSIPRMRMYGPNPNALNALRGSNIEFILDVPNGDLKRLADSQAEANTWVRDNVQKYNDVRFKYISVGNEVKPGEPGAAALFQAMQNIDRALSAARLSDIKVSTTTFMRAFADTYPPSRGRFKDEYRNFLQPVIGFLVNKRSPLLVNIYTYFGYMNRDVSLEFALFQPNSNNEFTDPNNQLRYQNFFDANLDSVYAALEKSGGGSLDVVVSESGWPTQGGPGASVPNAEAYVNNLRLHVNKNGSPKRSGKPIETYIFAMFDENGKQTSPNDEYEKYWGMFSPTTRQLKYGVKFN